MMSQGDPAKLNQEKFNYQLDAANFNQGVLPQPLKSEPQQQEIQEQ